VNQPVFADVEIARSGAAAPVIGQTFGDVVLEAMHAREAAFFQSLHLVIDAAFLFAQRLQLPVAIVNDADRRCEAQLDRTLSDYQRVLRMRDPAANHRVDIHMEVGMLGQELQFLVQDLQALLRDVVGVYVVDGNLQPLEAGAVQALNAFRNQEIAVGDETGDHPVGTDATDDVIEFGVHQRLAAGDRHHRGA